MIQFRSNRGHQLAKGRLLFEDVPEKPRLSHTAAITLAALALGAVAYASAGSINCGIDKLLNSPAKLFIDTPTLPEINIVNLGYASYRGLINDTVPDVISWLGIPYAQPPRRFRGAQPFDETPRKHNVTDAQEYPPFCIQGYSSWLSPNDTGGAGSENSLYLYLLTFTAEDISPETLVAGEYKFKQKLLLEPKLRQCRPFDNWILRSPSPFVAVTIYYRLSILGFLSAPEEPGEGIYEGNDPELLLNAGIHDQRLALRFIQRHIRSFGGDPERVTIMGESAGAGAVVLHLAARSANPASDCLFRRAVVQSWYRTPFALPAARKEQWEAVSNSVGCSTNSSTVVDTLECLRTVNPVRLVQAADDGKKQHSGPLWAWLPVVDGTLFKKNPGSVLRTVPDLDIIVGHTTADSSSSGTPFEAVVNATYPGLTSDNLETLKAMYTEVGITEENMAEFGLGEAMFRCGTHFLANLYGPRAHTYRWDEPDPIDPNSAGHASDNYILMLSNGTTEFHALTPAQRGLSDETVAYLTSFYATASPNVVDTSSSTHPVWPTHSSGKRIVFRAEGGGTGDIQGKPGASFIEKIDRKEAERCKFWNSLVDRIGI
ncbi:hypothetical protein BN14_04333 [Rhizoctonia solani AG-1 IB]|uniref:Carboxylic ester hydrolase n=1 Tax=Thanatephorus cucumeris (strain AG1-IB / isolate 7/3/14) TaxID=1108050 RepID=M5BSW1_THACB|nr:hypothetical protein BN14_04333 [Rhizoctonia solani AG-1 IB]